MADNTQLSAGTADGVIVAGATLTISGDSAIVQMMSPGILSGAENSWTYSQVVGGAGAVAAGVQRVTLASDDPAVVDLAAIEVLLTAANVDHAANEVLLTTIAGDTTSLDSKVTACNTGAVVLSSGTLTSITNAVAVTGTFWQATQPVSLASVPSHAVTNAGTFAVQESGAALTALQLIDDVVYADDADWTDGTSKHVLTGGLYQSSRQAVTDGDVAPFQITSDGRLIMTDVDGAGNDLEFAKEGDNWNAADHGVTLFARDTDSTPDKYRAIQVDANGHIKIGDGGNSLTVDNGGTFAVQAAQSGTWNITNVSGTISLPTGAATAALQGGGLPAALGAGGGLKVDGSGTALPVSGTFWQSTQPVSLASVPSHNVTNAGTFAVQSTLQSNSGVDIGDVDVASISAGANLIGDVGIQGRTTGGLSIYYDNDLDETAVVVKAGAGTLYGMHVINMTAAPLYLQLFNVAQGSVTVGSTTPTVQFVVPGNADSDGAGFTFAVPQGIAFATAITAACSTDSEGNGAPAANACHCNLFYK